MHSRERKESERLTWWVIGFLVMFILGRGLFALWVVGDPDHPGWDYRPVRDIPGESGYAIYEALPSSQHIKGKGGK